MMQFLPLLIALGAIVGTPFYMLFAMATNLNPVMDLINYRKNQPGNALAAVIAASIIDQPDDWSGCWPLANRKLGLTAQDRFDGAEITADGTVIPCSSWAGRRVVNAIKRRSEDRAEAKRRAALQSVRTKLHVIDGGRS